MIQNINLTPGQIKTMRRAMGMTQEQLGAALGFSGQHTRKAVNRWETGAREPSLTNLQQLVEIYIIMKAQQVFDLVLEKKPERVNLTAYNSQEEYDNLRGDGLPLWLHNQVNDYVAQGLRKQGIQVDFTEISESIYLAWLKKKDLPNTPEARALFVATFNVLW